LINIEAIHVALAASSAAATSQATLSAYENLREKLAQRLTQRDIDGIEHLDSDIERVREAVRDPMAVDPQAIEDIDRSFAALKAQMEVWAELVAVEQKQRAELVGRLRNAEQKSKSQFWWGIVLGLPIGLFGSVIAWAVGIS
jgi:hypothetical protein